MNILYVTEFFPPEHVAGAYRALAITKGLSTRGHNVTVLTTYPNFPKGKRFPQYKNNHTFFKEKRSVTWHIIRFPIIERPNTNKFNRVVMYLSFLLFGFFYFVVHIKAFKQDQFDIVIGSSGPIFVIWLAWIIKTILRTKLVVEYRDLQYALLSDLKMSKSSFIKSIFKKIEITPAKHAELIIVLTNSFKMLLQKEGLNDKRIFVLTNGAPYSTIQDIEDKKSTNSKANKRKFVIGYFGAIGISQNLCTIVSSVQFLKNTSCVLLIVGEGSEKEKLMNIIRTYNLQNVKLHNAVPRVDLEKFYTTCDICLVSLRQTENFSYFIPSKIFDIMAHKKAILFIGPKGEASNIIEKAGSGILIHEDDPLKIAFYMKKIIYNNKELLLKMGENGYNFVLKQYNWDLIIQKYESLLLKLLKNEE